ncbi:hypothetical protein DVH24_003262 [Malus domestica]|uniref:Late embryogenesis abundant protein LEA-2 subgroup domain-containing protein n=1 Tax=Malus domestica TaxID=3750 RepID=A0A498IKT4_MALDO|nr:hypothetical protein DVH24_003262 [Malus domestica]
MFLVPHSTLCLDHGVTTAAAFVNNILNYNLALNFTIRNFNKRAGLVYRGIQVIGKYRNKKFFVASLGSTPFYQDHKNTTIVPVVLQGQQWVKFRKRDVSRFRRLGLGCISIPLYERNNIELKAFFLLGTRALSKTRNRTLSGLVLPCSAYCCSE